VKRVVLALSILALVGTPFVRPTPAHACSCVGLEPTGYAQTAEVVVLGTVRDVKFDEPLNEAANRHGPNIIGTHSDVTGRVFIQIEAFLKGWADEVVIQQDEVAVWRDDSGQVRTEFQALGNCRYFGGVPVGQRHLLFLNQGDSDLFGTSICSGSHELHPTSDPEPYAGYNGFYIKYLADMDSVFGFPPGTLLAAANSSGPVSLPDGGGPPADDALSLLDAAGLAALAVVGPLAFLAAAAFLWRRGEPHS
jgi:hypothetical protein